MSKLNQSIFTFTPKEGIFGREVFSDLITNDDAVKFCKQFIGKRLMVSVKEKPEKNTKESMYAFYHSAVLGIAIICFTEDGYVAVDQVKADYMLKAECAKVEMYNQKTGKTEIFIEEKANMSTSRLHKYIVDCINWLEMERGYVVPDSLEFKNPGFKIVK